MSWFQDGSISRRRQSQSTVQTLSNEEKLKRFIYITNLYPRYYCGGHERYSRQLTPKAELMREMFPKNLEDFLRIIVAASGDRLLPYRSQLFSLLGFSLTLPTTTAEMKPEICATALSICQSDEDFFDFIQFSSSYRFEKSKLSKSVQKTIRNYFKNKTPLELAQSYAFCKSWHGWTHKDLIKLGHVKPDTLLKDKVMNYILFKKLTESNIEEERQIIDILRKSEILRKTKDHRVAVPLIEELKATINQVEPSLRKSAEVWNSVLRNMSVSDILKSLTKLYKLGFLKKDTPTQAIVNKTLTNVEKIQESGIHPIEVYIRMKNFEKGGKPLDIKLIEHLVNDKKMTDEEIRKLKCPKDAKCPVVLNNLQTCMNIACANVPVLGKRYLITIDTTDKMSIPCLSNKNITAIEGAVAFAWCLMKAEKDVTVAVFKENEVSVVELDRTVHLNEHVQKLRENRIKYVIPAAPMEWAASQKKYFDFFFTFIHHREFWTAIPKDIRDKMTLPEVALDKYRKKLDLPDAKLITFCLSSPKFSFCDGSRNIMDATGFDSMMPRAVEVFCRGIFC